MVQPADPFSFGPQVTQRSFQAIALWELAMSLPVNVTVEVLRFAGRRISAQADHLAEIARCKSFVEALNSQSAFFQSAASDYREEAEALMKEIRVAAPSTKVAA